jgi:hypothetical protein
LDTQMRRHEQFVAVRCGPLRLLQCSSRPRKWLW